MSIQVEQNIQKEIYTYFREIESIANELTKFIKNIDLSILDLTADTRVLGASLQTPVITSIYKYNLSTKRISNQKNLIQFKDLELILDSILAFDRNIGILCIDAKTTEDMYFGVESAIAVVQPPIMVLGSSIYENAIKVEYSNCYTFKVIINNVSQELGKVFYNARTRAR